jgi:hypothetical protein
LHEGFHNELNQLTLYGYLLIGNALLTEAADLPATSRLAAIVDNCRTIHETYATFLSTTIMVEQGARLQQPEELLEGYPGYQTYYRIGQQLAADFQGNFLREKIVTAVAIACLQSESLVSALTSEKGYLLSINEFRRASLPDARLSFIGRHLPPGFWTNSLQAFTRISDNSEGMEIIHATEKDPSAYKLAIAPTYDDLTELLLQFFVVQLSTWLNDQERPTFPAAENLPILREWFPLVNKQAEERGIARRLAINDSLYDATRNVVLNFSAESYLIHPEPIPAQLALLGAQDSANYPYLAGGTGTEKHFLVVSRPATNLLRQYQFPPEEVAWLRAQGDAILTFIRRRVRLATTEGFTIQLFLLDNLSMWTKFLTTVGDIPIVSSLSLRGWATEQWANTWLAPLADNTQCTILFDLPPEKQLEPLFSTSCDFVAMTKSWIKHQNYNHCALVLQGKLKDQIGGTPLFLLPAGEILCNVISNYAEQAFPAGFFHEDKAFLMEEQWLMRIALSRIFNEERAFAFSA